MTETEWVACDSPVPMIRFLRDHVSERKLRLFGVACCRAIWNQLADRRSRRAVDVAERYADGLTAHEEVRNASAASVLRGGRGIEFAATITLSEKPYVACVRITRKLVPDEVGVAAVEEGQCQLLRCIFSNPFRPVTFSPSWRTSTAVALAAQMYEARHFSAMPILADALQDAGCDRAEVLDHCREPGAHVRGCWVVDLVLGKE